MSNKSNNTFNNENSCTKYCENCSSCNDTLCMFHEKNFNKDSYIAIKKMLEEKIKSMPAS